LENIEDLNKTCQLLVTGANGQLGREIQDIAAQYPDMEFMFKSKSELDISNRNEVVNLFQENRFEFLINCAAFTHVDKAEESIEKVNQVNIQGVKNLAEVCKENEVTMIHISSDYIYNSKEDPVYHEDSLCEPKGVYANSKLRGEELLKSTLEAHIIIRTSWVYSAHGNNFVKTMLSLGKVKQSLNIVKDQIGSPTYAADLANTILEVIKKVKEASKKAIFYGTYNYSNLGFISWAEFAEEIFKIKNFNVKINYIPSSDYPTAAERPFNSKMSKSKIADTFSLTLCHWKKSLKKCIQEIDNSLLL
jgi:dTDP-4-dehydrorhamnose reductase